MFQEKMRRNGGKPKAFTPEIGQKNLQSGASHAGSFSFDIQWFHATIHTFLLSYSPSLFGVFPINSFFGLLVLVMVSRDDRHGDIIALPFSSWTFQVLADVAKVPS